MIQPVLPEISIPDKVTLTAGRHTLPRHQVVISVTDDLLEVFLDNLDLLLQGTQGIEAQSPIRNNGCLVG